MTTDIPSRRWTQITAWAVLCLFLLGFFFPLVGAWTGAVLGAWFVGTQKPWRGFQWMMALTLVPSLLWNWRRFPVTGPAQALEYVAWMVVIALLGVLPFLFHRLVSPRLPGLLSMLPLPMAGAAIQTLGLAWLPAGVLSFYSVDQGQRANAPLMDLAAVFGVGAIPFLMLWFAAAVVWIWNAEFRAKRIAVGASIFAPAFAVAAGFGLWLEFSGAAPPRTLPAGFALAWVCLAGALVLGGWALFNSGKPARTWTDRQATVALLQSPYTGSPLRVVREQNRETLVSEAGERFAIRNGIPILLKPDEITGDNRKYNHLYETIGGFYDDIQRVFCALKRFDRDAYFLSYMRLLEVKPGDSVLETSVGTGLNFKYLPRGAKLSGLDLSWEMLTNCQANMRRWEMDADLYLGNAESLPFADSSFDVVFHVGGINFFSDRGKAIREMIRVARPGSLLLIADETEEHAKSAYENSPVIGHFFKNRKEPVRAPIDLLPAGMEEVRLDLLKKGMFYALTFRKPVLPQDRASAHDSTAVSVG